MASKKSKRAGSKPGMDAPGAARAGPKRAIGRGPKRADPPARAGARATPPGAARAWATKMARERRRQRETKTGSVKDGAGSPASANGAKAPDSASTPGAAEPGLRELADRASRSLGKRSRRPRRRPRPPRARWAGSSRSSGSRPGRPRAAPPRPPRRWPSILEGGIDEAFGKISEQARDLMSKGQHTRVRIKSRGRQLTELPIAVVAAAEAASLWWFGPLRLLLGHVVGKTVLDVEFVSNADAHVAEGRALLADGELEKALAAFDLALSMDRKCAAAWLGRGVALQAARRQAGRARRVREGRGVRAARRIGPRGAAPPRQPGPALDER